MADMTHKHHNLIFDAIKEASEVFVRSTSLRDVMEVLGLDNSYHARRLNRSFVTTLAGTFSKKLRYTNDKFEAGPWRQQVIAIADDVFVEWEREISAKSA